MGKTDRMSFSIFLSAIIIIVPLLLFNRVSAGSFWCYRKNFEAIQGFDERFVTAEDIDFAKRLRAYGKKQSKKFGTLWRTQIITSARKGDMFGDWYMLTHPKMVFQILSGKNQDAANKYYYDVKR